MDEISHSEEEERLEGALTVVRSNKIVFGSNEFVIA